MPRKRKAKSKSSSSSYSQQLSSSSEPIQKPLGKYASRVVSTTNATASGDSINYNHLDAIDKPIQIHGVSPEKLYHFLLSLQPHEFDLLREIAAQMIGKKGFAYPELNLMSNPKIHPGALHDITRTQSAAHTARVLLEEAREKGAMGGGFQDAVRHVISHTPSTLSQIRQQNTWAGKSAAVGKFLAKLAFLTGYDNVGTFLLMASGAANMIDRVQQPRQQSYEDSSNDEEDEDAKLESPPQDHYVDHPVTGRRKFINDLD